MHIINSGLPLYQFRNAIGQNVGSIFSKIQTDVLFGLAQMLSGLSINSVVMVSHVKHDIDEIFNSSEVAHSVGGHKMQTYKNRIIKGDYNIMHSGLKSEECVISREKKNSKC